MEGCLRRRSRPSFDPHFNREKCNEYDWLDSSKSIESYFGKNEFFRNDPKLRVENLHTIVPSVPVEFKTQSPSACVNN